MFGKLLKLLVAHKLITGIGLLVIVVVSYFGYQGLAGGKVQARYLTATVERGTLITSLTGSGQVSASNQVDIKPKASGDVVYVGVKNSQEVKIGTLLAQINNSNAQKEVRNAQTTLETANLELEKLLSPADKLSLLQAENALIQAQDSLTKLKFTQASDYQDTLDSIQEAEDNLAKGYEDAFNTIANAFLDLPTVITGLDNILYGYGISNSEITIPNTWNKSALLSAISPTYYNERQEMEQFINSTESNYKAARDAYNDNFNDYKEASRYSKKEVIESLLTETKETTKLIAQAVKSETNMLDYWVDYRSQRGLSIYSKVTDYQSDLKSYTSKTNSHLSSLLSIQSNIENSKKAKLKAEQNLLEIEQNNPLNLAAAERTVKEKEESLTKLKAAPDELDIRAKRIAIQQKEDALLAAQESLANHYIRAPFDGIVASLNVKKGETVSSGSTLVTLITKQKIAEITLNEVDVAKVALGQKATITFDAIEDLSLTGEVVEIDTLGTVSQGVVTYNIKIAFDTEDERVKPGMSLSATVITDIKQDVLLVPNSAIKQQGDISYVQLVSGTTTETTNASVKATARTISLDNLYIQEVQIGLSNDTMTEIIDGLKEGEQVVTQVITSNSNQSQSPGSTGFSLPGLGLPTTGGGMRQMMR